MVCVCRQIGVQISLICVLSVTAYTAYATDYEVAAGLHVLEQRFRGVKLQQIRVFVKAIAGNSIDCNS